LNTIKGIDSLIFIPYKKGLISLSPTLVEVKLEQQKATLPKEKRTI
tara:strand:+ start:98 stop:235 length:138 start_codon:yes stop_codon:yes gene_type:complete